ncbi:ankyrin [Dendrothele bispora CBS 962.96]|uniref:Ankyrin n=1 Tax=Dendrothele bispora (strain CBS 962.96) TaxID=1314807 RepID=A0A4V4HEB9_DENBC|nr:ankyrin [Dendrothele bispora CBS 962.96]
MRKILSKPGFLKSTVAGGGQRLRELYSDASASFDATKLSPFGTACYLGSVEQVIRLFALANGNIDLKGHESGFNLGYVSITTLGAQRVTIVGDIPTQHHETLQFLLSQGASVDSQDICGHTALQHACQTGVQNKDLVLRMMRTLLDKGANVNHQNRYGEVALFFCIMKNNPEALDILMEYNADLEVPEADGITPRSFYLRGGPQITAVISKWIRKRNGEEEMPRQGKKCCDGCGKENVALKACARCHVARYCSVECQRKQWSTHKPRCQPFSTPNTVVLKPSYESRAYMTPLSSLSRQLMGYDEAPTPERNFRGAQVPKLASMKNLIIKVQVPWMETPSGGQPAPGNGPLAVYTKKRDFVCCIKRNEQANAYDQISKVVKTKGHRGSKAYFAAELRSKDELVVKISEVLAEQPF